MADKARFHVVMPVATRARLNGLAADTGLAASALTRLAIDRLLAEPDPLGTKGTKMATNTQESSTMAIAKAEAAFALAKIEAEGRKQASMELAMKLPMPEHAAAIRAAERAYHTALAQAADASGGIIQSAPYRNAAAPA
jgi:hypothetical protein